MTTDGPPRPEWDFLWRYYSEEDGPEPAWKTKRYRSPTFAAACRRFLAFLDSRLADVRKPYFVQVDYEARAGHEPYAPEDHERTFPDLRHHPDALCLRVRDRILW